MRAETSANWAGSRELECAFPKDPFGNPPTPSPGHPGAFRGLGAGAERPLQDPFPTRAGWRGRMTATLPRAWSSGTVLGWGQGL